jgi:hypothetical protein
VQGSIDGANVKNLTPNKKGRNQQHQLQMKVRVDPSNLSREKVDMNFALLS